MNKTKRGVSFYSVFPLPSPDFTISPSSQTWPLSTSPLTQHPKPRNPNPVRQERERERTRLSRAGGDSDVEAGDTVARHLDRNTQNLNSPETLVRVRRREREGGKRAGDLTAVRRLTQDTWPAGHTQAIHNIPRCETPVACSSRRDEEVVAGGASTWPTTFESRPAMATATNEEREEQSSKR